MLCSRGQQVHPLKVTMTHVPAHAPAATTYFVVHLWNDFSNLHPVQVRGRKWTGRKGGSRSSSLWLQVVTLNLDLWPQPSAVWQHTPTKHRWYFRHRTKGTMSGRFKLFNVWLLIIIKSYKNHNLCLYYQTTTIRACCIFTFTEMVRKAVWSLTAILSNLCADAGETDRTWALSRMLRQIKELKPASFMCLEESMVALCLVASGQGTWKVTSLSCLTRTRRIACCHI